MCIFLDNETLLPTYLRKELLECIEDGIIKNKKLKKTNIKNKDNLQDN